MFLDSVEKYQSDDKERLERMKLALFAREEYLPEKLFPERFGKNGDETSDDDDDVEWDYTNVEWKSPKDMKDEEQLRKIMGLIHQGAGRMNIAQAQEQRDEGWV